MLNSLLRDGVIDAIKDRELDPVVVKQLVENEILEALMKSYRYNQSRVAKIYGVSRGTLRTVLKERFGDEYVGSRGL